MQAEAAAVKAALTKRLGNCEVLDERGLFRCHRRASEADAPYAVWYVDSTGDVPTQKTDLLNYEERILAKDFYGGPKHLRWNHYLVFAVPTSTWKGLEATGQKRELESDTTYARKFLIRTDELDAFLARTSKLVPSPISLPQDPTLVWKKKLSSSGLDEVIYAPVRSAAVAKWLAGQITSATSNAVQTLSDAPRREEDGKRLQHISWQNFRTHPEHSSFDFLDVNLISGVNGVGKTSLLEAIEAFYCGTTLRNPGDSVDGVVGMLAGSSRAIRLPHTPDARRKRELRWFGDYWRGKDELNDKFNKFLFFNSDAAYRLEHSNNSGQFVGTALANVALGTEATELWGKIEEFHSVFTEEKKSFDRQRKDLQKKRRDLEQRLKGIQEQSLASSAYLDTLREALADAAWNSHPKSLEEFETSFAAQIASVTDRFASFDRLVRLPLARGSFPSAARQWSETRDKAGAALKELTKSERAVARGKEELEALQVRQTRLARLRRYVTSGWLKTYCALQIHTTRSNALTYSLETLAESDLTSLPPQYLARPLKDAFESAEQVLRDEQKELSQAKRALSSVRRTQADLHQLRVQIQSLAQEALQLVPDLENCPLCGTKHPKGDLAHRLEVMANTRGEAESELTKATRRVSTAERAVRKAALVRGSLALLLTFVASIDTRRQRSVDTVQDVVRLVESLKESLGKERAELDRALAALAGLEKQSLSEDQFLELWNACISEKAIDDFANVDALTQKLVAAEERNGGALDDFRISTASLSGSRDKLFATLSVLLKDFRRRDTTLDDAYAELTAYVQDVTAFVSALEKHASVFGGTGTFTSAEFVKQQGQLKRVSAELLQAISLERSRRLEQQGLAKQVADSKVAEAKLTQKLERAELAVVNLNDLKNNHGRDLLLKQFIDENRTRISDILRVIHAPREFKGVGEIEPGSEHRLSLVRENGRSVGLSKISTGQRCAVALSVFFTLNMQLRVAPPIVIMDDPVPHVDDLNVLALLDYLREIAVSGQRQVFFATANEKLAGIFEQKFGSMSERFRRHTLTRARN